ncbi:DUF887-domain-containing protein, partial [Aulographum hederae CBS 113979]
MHDPFPIPRSAFLSNLVQPLADRLNLVTLPIHIHEVLIFFCFYLFVQLAVSPVISPWLFPTTYPKLNARTQLNWDVHVVSFVQSVLVCSLALWVASVDEERADMNWQGRVWGYTGAGGLVQAAACGYFMWDLWVTIRFVNVFGVGMLAHAVSALSVFCLGFRPFVNYYGSVFILYELSSPFLNIHWFCDKLALTGSNVQLTNGIVLLTTFFCCRLCWGTYSSLCVIIDVLKAYRYDPTDPIAFSKTGLKSVPSSAFNQTTTSTTGDPNEIWEIMKFAGDKQTPIWLMAAYLAANITLNTLNFHWFGKMIATIRKRFDPPFGTR